MPMYEYKCEQCKEHFTVFKKLVQYREPAEHTCGTVGIRVISKPMIAVDYPAYESPVTGKRIEGKRAHLEELKQTGCRLLEPGERENYVKQQEKTEAATDRMVDKMVEKTFTELKGN